MTPHNFTFEGVEYTFHVANPDDHIQSHHLRGELFDYDELLAMSGHVDDGDLIVDIGANVGNHAVYFAKAFPSSRIVVFEPFGEAAALLRANLDANGCTNVDRTFIGTALSSSAGRALLQRGGTNNLGGTRINPDADLSMVPKGARRFFEDVPTLTADEALAGLRPKLIKVDVEGHEFEVLGGMSRVLTEARPSVFVEVWHGHREQFDAWLAEFDYQVAWSDDSYSVATNYLVTPR